VGSELEPNLNDSECPQDWRARKVTAKDHLDSGAAWLKEQAPLFEAFWVAVTFHVLLFPLIYFVGWALPWPKPPGITTVIEINLEHWPHHASPTKIEELYDYDKSKPQGAR